MDIKKIAGQLHKEFEDFLLRNDSLINRLSEDIGFPRSSDSSVTIIDFASGTLRAEFNKDSRYLSVKKYITNGDFLSSKLLLIQEDECILDIDDCFLLDDSLIILLGDTCDDLATILVFDVNTLKLTRKIANVSKSIAATETHIFFKKRNAYGYYDSLHSLRVDNDELLLIYTTESGYYYIDLLIIASELFIEIKNHRSNYFYHIESAQHVCSPKNDTKYTLIGRGDIFYCIELHHPSRTTHVFEFKIRSFTSKVHLYVLEENWKYIDIVGKHIILILYSSEWIIKIINICDNTQQIKYTAVTWIHFELEIDDSGLRMEFNSFAGVIKIEFSYEDFRALVTSEMNTMYSHSVLYARSDDGAEIPITLIYDSHHTKQPCLAYVKFYSCYGSEFSDYSSSYLKYLIKQGYAVAITHCRGGGDLGSWWHYEGRGPKNKLNAIADLSASVISLTDALAIKEESISIATHSAGGVLASGYLKKHLPKIGSLILEGPFLDPEFYLKHPDQYLSMVDSTEWIYGEEDVGEIADLCLLKEGPYPNILIRCSANDTISRFYGTLSWFLNIRNVSTNSPILILDSQTMSKHALPSENKLSHYHAIEMVFLEAVKNRSEVSELTTLQNGS